MSTKSIDSMQVSKHAWKWAAVTSIGYSGGIIVLWHHKLGSVTLIAALRRSLHLVISSQSFDASILLVVYNGQSIEAQKRLWKELSCITILKLPLIIISDFNSICSRFEHKGSSFNHYARKATPFNDFIAKNALLEINYLGPDFT